MWERLSRLWLARADDLHRELGGQARFMLYEAHRMLPALPGRRAVLLTLRRPRHHPRGTRGPIGYPSPAASRRAL
ncbi:hypothetical protein IQ61_30315 [Streptomyces scabiei]|nr:hypothetical protein IQ61_30315 [Streptomyces scabiei]